VRRPALAATLYRSSSQNKAQYLTKTISNRHSLNITILGMTSFLASSQRLVCIVIWHTLSATTSLRPTTWPTSIVRSMMLSHDDVLCVLSLAASTTYAVSCTGRQTNPYDLAACANELTARGIDLCTVTRGFTTTFCQIGAARVVGVGVGTPNGKEASSPW
jgi:hypothetical protein